MLNVVIVNCRVAISVVIIHEEFLFSLTNVMNHSEKTDSKIQVLCLRGS